ncbi:MAG: UDP-N-acetylmuramoyl-tripeptide--D-alanyl-D-alanine ligase [Coriobacteriales bacterium]|nr:UDP-N-acetylmuramoyl-tripeptide--D-alanyl-D-alanine ligase [Coriobacteriales bacterium]
MMDMSVADVASVTGAQMVCGDPAARLSGVDIDSRKVPAGGVFVAFAGQKVDGNKFAAKAIRDGAGAVVVTEDPTADALKAADECGAAILRAADDDGTEFMLRLAGEWRRRNPGWHVVGVAGSVGKTTTKDMLACGLATAGKVHATKGNFNNLLGVPLTLLSAPADADYLVVEMGMNHAGEMTRLTHAVRPNVAVITNIGTSHIGNLGSRENIARAKAEIVAGLTASPEGQKPCLVLTGEDDFTPLIRDEYCVPAGVDVLLVGSRLADAVSADGIQLDQDGMPSFQAHFDDGLSFPASLPVPGRHMVSDFLTAMGAIWRMGVDRRQAAQAIAHMQATHMRLEVLQNPGTPRVIDDTYNASPSSVAAALDVLCSMRCDGRRIAVLGEVGELGDQAHFLHGLMGAYAAAKPLDLLVLIGGEDARTMADAALTMGFSEDHLEVFDSVERALDVIAPILEPDDLVLAKASRAAGLDRFSKGVLDR